MENNTIDTLQIKIDDARSHLKKETREAIDSVDWKMIIAGMTKYTPDQLDELETETDLLLCGISNPENYESELSKRMLLTKEQTSSLISEMNKLIFNKIKDELEKRLNKKEVVEVKVENKPIVLDPRFSKMPKGLQESIAKSGWRENLYKISENHKLNIEQMGLLEEITVRVITNEIPNSNYYSELSSKLQISKEEAILLVGDINNSVLLKIRELLKNYQEKPIIEKIEFSPATDYTPDKIPLPPYSKIRSDHAEPIKPLNLKKEEVFKMPEIPKNIMEDKLKNITASDNTISDYSVPKTASIPSSGPHDPYREEI